MVNANLSAAKKANGYSAGGGVAGRHALGVLWRAVSIHNAQHTIQKTTAHHSVDVVFCK